MRISSGRTRALASAVVLGALVIVFDYTLKISGLKIPFPWLPFLKLDITGVPIVLSFLLYGIRMGALTSAVAGLAIEIRATQDPIGAPIKAIAEFSTILGMFLLSKWSSKLAKISSFVSGLILRVLVMIFVNQIVFGEGAKLILPSLAAFNLLQGSVSEFGGYLLYKAVARRIPFLTKPILPERSKLELEETRKAA